MADQPNTTVNSDSAVSHAVFPHFLPQSTYVPGLTARPRHETSPVGETLEQALARGAFLFQHGYYWEAHEAWEAAWISAGRTGPLADYLKALIKLAASGVKCLVGNRTGAIRHAKRARELLQGLHQREKSISKPGERGTSVPCFHEQLLASLEAFASTLAADPPIATDAQREAAKSGGVKLFEDLNCPIPVFGH